MPVMNQISLPSTISYLSLCDTFVYRYSIKSVYVPLIDHSHFPKGQWEKMIKSTRLRKYYEERISNNKPFFKFYYQ